MENINKFKDKVITQKINLYKLYGTYIYVEELVARKFINKLTFLKY